MAEWSLASVLDGLNRTLDTALTFKQSALTNALTRAQIDAYKRQSAAVAAAAPAAAAPAAPVVVTPTAEDADLAALGESVGALRLQLANLSAAAPAVTDAATRARLTGDDVRTAARNQQLGIAAALALAAVLLVR